MMASTMKANLKFMMSIITAMPNISVMPQTKSKMPQARILDSRSLSDVIRAINQPTGR